MGKKKNKNKVSGAVKTAAKTEKKLANKLKKELANLGEEDIAKVVAQIEREEAKRAAASENNLPGPPSARAYATLTPHPTLNELILFGGEYHNGQKTEVYNELIFYNPVSNSWRQVKAPGAPPPRSAHQAVATPANKGELWVFGGEFTSPSETQFYHYKDLWCFSLAEKKWEKVVAPNGPSARSGHRMSLLGRKLLVFGGYCDDGRECRYHDDLYAFSLDTRTWEKITPNGRGPSPRSACLMLPAGNDSVIIYGGFSRVRDGRTERACTHTDMFRLSCSTSGSWAWRSLGGGARTARAGLAAAVNVHANRAYVFGGVNDVEETEEELKGEMSDDLSVLDLETARWHGVTLRSDQPRPPAAQDTPKEEPCPEPVTVITDEVFTIKLGGGPVVTREEGAGRERAVGGAVGAGGGAVGAGGGAVGAGGGAVGAGGGPSARMSATLAAHRSVLYVYGGVLEKEEKQFYLGDMYSLDLHKLNEWKTIICQPALPDWLGSDSEEYDSDGSEDESDSDDSDEQ